MQPQSSSARGVTTSVTASFLFGFLYFYATLLTPLTGMEIFGWRMLWTLPFLTAFMVKAGYWHLVTEIWNRACRKPLLFPVLLLSSFLLGVQFWLFLWAPVNGKALEVSLGYLLMPLVMVVCGRVFYKEHLLPYQKIAVFFAVLGVANQAYRLGGFSWEVMLVALGFPAYFTLRRKLQTESLGGLWLDMLCMLPAACYFLHTGDAGLTVFGEHPVMYAKIPLLGAISALAVALYITASKLLPMGLFGLLSYVEPSLLVCVSLLLGDRMTPGEELTYTGVGLAVMTLVYGGFRHFKAEHARAAKTAPASPGNKKSHG
ncbi:MAG: Protein RarD [Desulfovibrio sp.]